MADRQTYNQGFFFIFALKAQSPWDTKQTRSPSESPVWSKVTTTIFFVLTNLDSFDLGTSLKKLCLSQGSNVAYIGHWPRSIYLFDRQTDRLTDRQVGRHIYSAMLELTDLISLSVDGLSPNCQWTVYYICVSLPVNKPYQTLVILHQYVLCGYDNVTFLLGGA